MTSTASPAASTAREYLRVSLDKSGNLQSPEEQHGENREAAGDHGWALGEPYREGAGVSASRYSDKARAAFDELTGDLRGGRFGADVLILWESSRGSRRVGEWVALIEACEAAGVQIYVTSQDNTYDPSRPHDRKSLLTDAVDSEYESGKTSLRIKRTARSQAAKGMPHGRIPYGYRREYEVNEKGKRVIVAQSPEPAEAAVITELFARLYKGDSLRRIAADFATRGITTRPGKAHPAGIPFTAAHLRDLALRPIYGGVRIHEAGNRSGRYHGSLESAVRALWPALTDAETFHSVRAMLTAPERRTNRPGSAVHLLSLIALCDVCGGTLAVRIAGGDPRYCCRAKGCVRINKADLDAYAEATMLAYLARPEVIAELRATPDKDNAALATLRGDLAEARGELASLRAAGKAGKLSVASLIEIEPGLVSRVAELESRERELSAPPALARLLGPGKDVAARWAAAPVSARRDVARLLLSSAALGQLRVGRAPVAGQRTAAQDRVRWNRAA